MSDVAADFLASVATQPLLCIGAVNPGLYAVNPALARAHELRARIVKALAVARSKGAPAKVRPMARTMQGSRRYLEPHMYGRVDRHSTRPILQFCRHFMCAIILAKLGLLVDSPCA